MSLNFNLTKIKNSKTVCYRPVEDGDYEMHPVTHAIIFATMAIGMGEITEKNHEEFFDRISKWEKVGGAFLQDGNGKPRKLTIEDIEKHIGLTTNVFPKESPKKFMSKLGKLALSKALEAPDV